MTPIADGRVAPGAAVLSARRLHLGARLHHASIKARFIAQQSTTPGSQIPPLRPPLVLDTPSLPLIEVVALLVEVTAHQPPLPTIALVNPQHIATLHVLVACPSVYAVVADGEDLRPLKALILLGETIDCDRPGDGPIWVGVIPPPPVPLAIGSLNILVALAHADTVEEAAQRCGMAERTLYRRLANLRDSLGLPHPTKGTRAQDLASTVLDALAHTSPRACSLAPPPNPIPT